MKHQSLLVEIDAYLAATGMSAYRFGILAVRNGRLVDRLCKGGRVWPETEQAVRDYIAANPPKAPTAQENMDERGDAA